MGPAVKLPDVFKVSFAAAGALVALTATTAPSWAIACSAPAPVFGVTGPYGLAVAGVVYGGYLLYKRYHDRG
jgi:hypothetical protein